MEAAPTTARSWRPGWVVLAVLAAVPLWALAAGRPPEPTQAPRLVSIPAPRLAAEIPLWSQVQPAGETSPPDPPPSPIRPARPGKRPPEPAPEPNTDQPLLPPVPAPLGLPPSPAVEDGQGGADPGSAGVAPASEGGRDARLPGSATPQPQPPSQEAKGPEGPPKPTLAKRVTLSAPVPAGPAAPAPLPAELASEAPGLILLKPPRQAEDLPDTDLMLVLTGCKACSSGGLLDPLAPPTGLFAGGCGAGCGAGGCGAGCVPGRTHCCSECEGKTKLGRFCCALYECICCPDPCYEPRWKPLADAAFFVDSARPQTQQRLRWDAGLNLRYPDRSEYFWPRADGRGKGPRPTSPFLGETELRYNTLSLYTEGATGNIGVFVEQPYMSIDPEKAPSAANFGDMKVGTKTLLFDCELLQLAFQFTTYIPVGNFSKGLGTGHASLEPSLIVGVKLTPDSYFQGQVSEWIPLGGDPDYEGAILHYHFSLNCVLYRFLPDVPMVGTYESNFWSFQDGLYTDPVLGPQRSSGYTYISTGPGLRLFVCDKIDFGLGTAYSVTDKSWAKQLFRSEFRWRY